MGWKELCAKDLMHATVNTVSETMPLLTAAKKMRDDRVSSLVVMPKNERDAFGMITRKDVLEALFLMDTEDMPMLVKDVMTKPVVTVSVDLSIHRCYQLMRLIGVRRLPVLDNKTLVGILSNTDLFLAMVGEIS